MSNIRTAKKENYSILSNGFINDPALSYQEIGLLTYLLSKPNNWNVNISHLSSVHTNGKDSVYAIIRSLGEKGYIHRDQAHTDGGRFASVDYVVYEEPVRTKGETASGKTVYGKTACGKSSTSNTELDQGLTGEMTDSTRASGKIETDSPQPPQNTALRKNTNPAPEVQNGGGDGALFASLPLYRAAELGLLAAAYPPHRSPNKSDITGRSAVRGAWMEAIDAGELPPIEALLADIERRKEGHDWQKEGQRFVPSLHNYLIKRVWTHPIAPPPEPKYRTVADMNAGGTGRLVI